MAFLSGGRRAATVSGDGSFRMWELLTGRPLSPREELLDDSGKARQLVVGPDEGWMVVVGEANILTCLSLGDLSEPPEAGMSPEDLRTFGEVLSGQGVHEAALATLTFEEWIERWRGLRSRHAQLLSLDLSPGEVAAWHRREAKRLEERLHWDAAAWHAARLRALGEPVDEGKLREFDAFVRSWRFAKVSEPWLVHHDSFVPMSKEKLRSIVASASTQSLVRSSGPFVDFLWCFEGKNADVVGYAVRSITSDRARPVKLLVGSDDALRIWLNGKLVIERPGHHTPVPDDESAVIDLTPGENTLVAEVSQGFGGWGLYLRIEDDNGQKLRLTDDGKLEPIGESASSGR